MQETRGRIAELYYRSNSVRFGQFRLSVHVDNPDLPLSPFYLHYPRPGEAGSELLPTLFDLIGEEFFTICESQDPPIRPRRIGAVPKGADPLADAHARRYPDYPANLLTFTKVEEPNGTIFLGPYGEFVEGEEMLPDDDHTSGGRNKKIILAAARAAGLVVPNMLTVVDRQQGGVRNMEEMGVRLLSIFTIDQLLQFGADSGYATQAQVDQAAEYRALNQY